MRHGGQAGPFLPATSRRFSPSNNARLNSVRRMTRFRSRWAASFSLRNDPLFTSIATMEHAVDSLRIHCINGITANAERSRDMVLNSLGIVTVLKPSLGYKQCAEIAREGYETGKSLHEIVVNEKKLLTQEKWDEVFSFENLISPKFEQ